MPPQSAWSKAESIGAPDKPSFDAILARDRYGDPLAPTVMRAPTWKESAWDKFRTVYEALLEQPAAKVGLLLAGSSPEQQRARFTEPPPEVTQAIALSPRARSIDALKLRMTIKGLEQLPENLRPSMRLVQDALYEYAAKPRYAGRNQVVGYAPSRLVSQFRGATMVPEVSTYTGRPPVASFSDGGLGPAVRRRGIDAAKRAEGRFDINFNPQRVAERVKTMDDARFLVGHELSHGAQALSDPSRVDLAYNELYKRYGYNAHPAEIMSNVTGYKRAGVVAPSQHQSTVWDLLANRDPQVVARDAWKRAREGYERFGVRTGGWSPDPNYIVDPPSYGTPGWKPR